MLQSSSRDNFGNFFFLLSCMFTPFISCLERKLVKKKRKRKKHTHMTREHMEKGEKKVDKTEDKRVVHSFTFSLSFSYNRFFLSITAYIKTVRSLVQVAERSRTGVWVCWSAPLVRIWTRLTRQKTKELCIVSHFCRASPINVSFFLSKYILRQ